MLLLIIKKGTCRWVLNQAIKENEARFNVKFYHMKYLSALLFTGIFSSPAFAQDGFYLSPSAGAGISNSGTSVYSTTANGYNVIMDKTPVPSYNMQIGVGYQYKKWRFQSGIQYFRSGFKIGALRFNEHFYSFEPAVLTGSGSYNISISQIGIPLQVGYAIPLSNKLSLVPYVGLLSSFTFAGSSRHDEYKETSKRSLSGAELNGYGRFTVWGLTGVQLEYKMNNKVSIFGGPSLQYRLGTTGNNTEGSFYNLNFNLGMKIELGKHK